MKLTSSVRTLLFLFAALSLFETSSAIPRPFVRGSSKLQSTSKPFVKSKSGHKKRQPKKNLVRQRNKIVTGGPKDVVDYGAILKYSSALCIQVTLSFGMWSLVDWTTRTFSDALKSYFWAKFAMVYFLNLQVGRFNILPTVSESLNNNRSPNRKRPSWTPPGWVFALMWPFFVFGTRAYTMAVVADKVGRFANPLTLAMMLHFGIGGLWSHVNRIEQQLGVSMLLLYALVGTKALAAYVAYQIDPRAGIALACTLSWLFAAAALSTATWRLNPDPKTGRPQSLVPRKA